MAKRILVALDRTTAPETLLDFVSDAARGSGATVRLLHVAPEPDSFVDTEGRTVVYVDQELARLQAEGLDALRTFELHFTDSDVDSVVRFGDPAHEILLEAEEFGAELIAMPTSRNAIKRVVCGSVAEKVARMAPMAVLLLRPPA